MPIDMIDVSKLAQLLSENFKGRIDFYAKVYGVVRDERVYNFYTSRGKFSLSKTSDDERYCLIKNEESSPTEFTFKLRTTSKVELEVLPNAKSSLQGIVVIRLPIDLAENSFLHIENPQSMFYTSPFPY